MNPQLPLPCYAKLNEKIRPLERGELHEDPLTAAFKENGFDSFTLGENMQRKSGEIEYVGVDVGLLNIAEGVPFGCRFLEDRGAPKGSVFEVGDERFPFGKFEAIAVYFDGVNLPSEVYSGSDINVVWGECEERILPKGKIRGFWHGPTETALYLYGESAKEMRAQIADFLASYPLCKGSHVETFATFEND